MPDELVVDANPFPIVHEDDEDGASLGFILLNWLVGKDNEVPPYWSRARDSWLRNFVAANGPLKTAVVTFINKAVTIPPSIQALDASMATDVSTAHKIQKRMWKNSGSMSSTVNKGFKECFKMFALDYLTQDNGAFMLVLGEGSADGPIVGPAMGLLHLDSARCTRTKNAEFPVIYDNSDGKRYKIHWTRIIEMSNMPSADHDLNGVGMCAVSCCLEAAQEMFDMYNFSAEKFGSRPPRQILYAKTGATVRNIEDAIKKWSLKMDNDRRSHFGGTMIAAPRTANQTLELSTIDLSSVPDGFDRKEVTTLDKAEIASAFGLDLRDLAYSFGISGQTRADAQVQDKKGRGKGVGEFLETFAERFNAKVLNADRWKIVFDNLDDDQDEQRAQIRDTRSMARERDLRSGVTDQRVERELMWERGEISQEQFEDLELLDGRLPNGIDVIFLFHAEDKDFSVWLDLGKKDPTKIESNEPEDMLDGIHDQIMDVSREVYNTSNAKLARKARQAVAALESLRTMYTERQEREAMEEQVEMQVEAQAVTGQAAPTTGPKPAPPNTLPKKEEEEETAIRPKAQPPPDALKQVDEIESILVEYEGKFAQVVKMALDDEIPRSRFEDVLAELVAEILIALWLRGAGLLHTELTKAERGAIQEAIDPHLNSVRDFSNDIYSGRYTETPSSALTRIFIWTNMAAGIYILGQMFRRDDPHYEWIWNPLKDHCSDCVRLNGQVHTASEWLASGFSPRSTALECRGFNCGCDLKEVVGPSRGSF